MPCERAEDAVIFAVNLAEQGPQCSRRESRDPEIVSTYEKKQERATDGVGMTYNKTDIRDPIQ